MVAMALIWLILAVILVALEIYLGFTLVFLFSALASLLVGCIVEIGLIPEDHLVFQFITFLFFTIASYILLWKPMKQFLDKKKATNPKFQNYVGQEVEVIDNKLVKGETGLVKWSGSFIRARISDSDEASEYNVGTKLTVESVEENVFIVKK